MDAGESIAVKNMTPEQIHFLAEKDDSMESPINLSLKSMFKVHLPELVWKNLDAKPLKMKISNTGQTVIIAAKWGESRPTVSGGALQDEYVFSQLHFHWGCKDTEGSEHTYENEALPLEMHAVFFKDSYGCQEIALGQKDGALVLVYPYKLDKYPNPALQIVCETMPHIELPGTSVYVDSVLLDTFVHVFTSDYFMYWGCVKTVGCKHMMLWLICRQALYVSMSQLRRFRSLFNPSQEFIMSNFRNIRPGNDGEVFHVNPSGYDRSILFNVDKAVYKPLKQKTCMANFTANSTVDKGKALNDRINVQRKTVRLCQQRKCSKTEIRSTGLNNSDHSSSDSDKSVLFSNKCELFNVADFKKADHKLRNRLTSNLTGRELKKYREKLTETDLELKDKFLKWASDIHESTSKIIDSITSSKQFTEKVHSLYMAADTVGTFNDPLDENMKYKLTEKNGAKMDSELHELKKMSKVMREVKEYQLDLGDRKPDAGGLKKSDDEEEQDDEGCDQTYYLATAARSTTEIAKSKSGDRMTPSVTSVVRAENRPSKKSAPSSSSHRDSVLSTQRKIEILRSKGVIDEKLQRKVLKSLEISRKYNMKKAMELNPDDETASTTKVQVKTVQFSKSSLPVHPNSKIPLPSPHKGTDKCSRETSQDVSSKSILKDTVYSIDQKKNENRNKVSETEDKKPSKAHSSSKYNSQYGQNASIFTSHGNEKPRSHSRNRSHSENRSDTEGHDGPIQTGANKELKENKQQEEEEEEEERRKCEKITRKRKHNDSSNSTDDCKRRYCDESSITSSEVELCKELARIEENLKVIEIQRLSSQNIAHRKRYHGKYSSSGSCERASVRDLENSSSGRLSVSSGASGKSSSNMLERKGDGRVDSLSTRGIDKSRNPSPSSGPAMGKRESSEKPVASVASDGAAKDRKGSRNSIPTISTDDIQEALLDAFKKSGFRSHFAKHVREALTIDSTSGSDIAVRSDAARTVKGRESRKSGGLHGKKNASPDADASRSSGGSDKSAANQKSSDKSPPRAPPAMDSTDHSRLLTCKDSLQFVKGTVRKRTTFSTRDDTVEFDADSKEDDRSQEEEGLERAGPEKGVQPTPPKEKRPMAHEYHDEIGRKCRDYLRMDVNKFGLAAKRAQSQTGRPRTADQRPSEPAVRNSSLPRPASQTARAGERTANAQPKAGLLRAAKSKSLAKTDVTKTKIKDVVAPKWKY